MVANFRALLSVKSADVERPKPLPKGHYLGTITEQSFGESRQKQTPFVRFVVTLESATDDVDEDALQGIDLSKKEIRKDYYITPNSLYRLSDTVDAVLGEDEDRLLEERVPEMRGARVMILVDSRKSDRGGEEYNEVVTMVSADAAQAAEDEDEREAAE